MKSKQKSQKKNKQNKQRLMPLLRAEQSLMGKPFQKLVVATDIINVTAGSVSLNFTGTGTNFYNLNLLSAVTDFTAVSAGYQVCRMSQIAFKISRVVTEAALGTVFTTGIGSVHVAYLPVSTNVTVSNANICINDSSLRHSAMSTSETLKVWPIPNVIAYRAGGTADFSFNLSEWFPTSMATNIAGQFSIGTNLSSAAAISSNLFSIEIYASFEFALPN